MSRVAAGDVIEVKPVPNVYTALVIAALLAEVFAFMVLYMKANEIFVDSAKSLFG
jgi:hypothetical protein